MKHIVSGGMEEVTYCFWWSSIKLQGYVGRQIDDVDPKWARPLGRSQLSIPLRFIWSNFVFLFSKPDLQCISFKENYLKRYMYFCFVIGDFGDIPWLLM